MRHPAKASGIGLVLLAAFGASVPTVASGQPEPSFEATCGELRQALRDLDAEEEAWVVIDVAGTLTVAEHDDTLGYMVMCEAPHPQVLCVTYEINDYTVGDRVVLSGTLERIDEDHIRLDPCLHYPPDSAQGD